MFLWESRCEDCVCRIHGMTLKCNTQRAVSFGRLFWGLGDTYNSIPITLLGTTLHLIFFRYALWRYRA